MNNVTVGLCYFQSVPVAVLDAVRMRMRKCAYFIDHPTSLSERRDGLGRIMIRPPEGLDLAIIVCDGTPLHAEYNVLGQMNQTYDDPWATLTLAVGSSTWKGPQPTIAVETSRYIGYHHVGTLHDDLSVMVETHRTTLFERGLSPKDWEFVRLTKEATGT